jgi:hypothetical protein
MNNAVGARCTNSVSSPVWMAETPTAGVEYARRKLGILRRLPVLSVSSYFATIATPEAALSPEGEAV